MKEKKYKSIKEVSKLLDLNTHVIRYWDSKFDGISTRLLASSQRFFNQKNIDKLKELKSTLYYNGKHNYSLDLANRIINSQQKDKLINPILKNINNLKISSIDDLIKIRDSLKELLDL